MLVVVENDYLKAKVEELKNLCLTINIEIIEVFTQSVKERRIGLFGKGKIQEIVELALEYDYVITYQRLSPIDRRVLQDAFNVPVLDKMRVILEIFAMRAQSKLAKMEVELVQNITKRDDLVGSYEGFSRQAGGSGSMSARGGGEQQLQLDRRLINRTIGRLKREIAIEQKKQRISKQRQQSNDLFTVALVGYTNAGKSTLMNQLLTQSNPSKQHKQVLSKNQVFSSLDTTTRKVSIDNYPSFLMVDTVGFIMDLPTELVASFESTLSIINEVDLVIVVLDYTYDLQVQLESVEPYLQRLEPHQILTVVNKIDKVSHNNTPYLAISAQHGVNIDKLLEKIATKKIENYRYKEGYVHPMFVHEFYKDEAFVFVSSKEDVDDLVYMKVYVHPKKSHLLHYVVKHAHECVGFS